MKQHSTILSTCLVALVLFSSCTTTQPLATSSAMKKSPEFIEGLTLSGGSNNIKMAPRITPSQAAMEAAELETAENRLHVMSDIRKGKGTNMGLYSFIEEWYGTPYRFGGTSKTGIDCSAFVRTLYENVYSLSLTRTSRDQFAATMRLKDKAELKEGDLVFFKIRSRNISHVGVYLSDGKFVHASSSRGVVISDLNDHYWVRYYAGGGRIGDQS